MSKIPLSSGPDSYKDALLDEKSVDPDPFRQFSAWFRDAVDSGISQPEAMFLATAGKNGIPSGRMVLLKGFDPRGFVFFTNYKSRKGSEIAKNPSVAIVFHWNELERQVRVTGKAQRTPKGESDEYFSARSLESQISAVISSQSSVIPGRNFLLDKFNELKRLIRGHAPDRPANWGGFRIVPDTFEFWQSRPHRLHDRIQYRLMKDQWIIERLAP